MKNKIFTFFKSEISIGISLIITTIISLLIVNSESYQTYNSIFSIKLNLNIDSLNIYKEMTLLDWINDGLMAIFFLFVGLELKKEILIGELSSKNKVLLPLIAAVGGVVVPIVFFIAINFKFSENIRGFAIPSATDIAFAYGIISLFGRKISNSLKVFLVALATIDDLIAILIIALFYSSNINLTYLALTIPVILMLLILNLKKCDNVFLYLICGFILWIFTLKSGIHATISGVILSMFIPLHSKNKPLLSSLAHKISMPVNFTILPIFAFANAGVSLNNFSLETLQNPIVLGIMLGLFFGKQIGIMAFSYIAIKMKYAILPRGTNWIEFYGMAIFTGIGFTMSIFIGSLAFIENKNNLEFVKIGVLGGSLLSVIFGSFVTYFATRFVK